MAQPGTATADARRQPLALSVYERLQQLTSMLEDRVSAVESRFNPVLRPVPPEPAIARTPSEGRQPYPPFLNGLVDELDKLDKLNQRLSNVLDRCEV